MRRMPLGDVTNRERRQSLPGAFYKPPRRPQGGAAGDVVAFVDEEFGNNNATKPASSRLRSPSLPNIEREFGKKLEMVFSSKAEFDQKVRDEAQNIHTKLLQKLSEAQEALSWAAKAEVLICS